MSKNDDIMMLSAADRHPTINNKLLVNLHSTEGSRKFPPVELVLIRASLFAAVDDLFMYASQTNKCGLEEVQQKATFSKGNP